MPAHPEPPAPNVPGTTAPMTAVTPGGKHGNGGSTPGTLGTVYTLCLTVLILTSLAVLAIPDLGRVATVLALVVGAGSAGILLGRSIDVEVNGHGLHVVKPQRVERVAPQQLPHEQDQRR